MSELPLSAADREPGGAPFHVAIIMDGNHRWARRRHLPGAAGHRAGAKNVRPIAEACSDYGVRCLTLFAFSTENWQRPKREVSLLLDLMRGLLDRDLADLDERNVRLNIIGDRSRFPADLQMRMNRAEALTRDNTRMTLNIAANYGGRWDIAAAAREAARQVAEGRIEIDDIDEDLLRLLAFPGPTAAAGSVHPHRRRPAHQQLPALGLGLHRTALRRGVLAGIRAGAPVGGLLGLRGAPAPIRLPECAALARGGACSGAA